MHDLEYILSRGVAEIIIEEELRARLASGRKLRLKEGFDPSFPDIHLGHIVSLRKLRQLQEHGHQVVLIVGDWTAQIGDPSGVSATRPMLTAEHVRANAETYMQQFFKVVDRSRTEVRWQTEWFGGFTLRDVFELTAKFTVAQMLARDDFATRYQNQQPVSVTELLYPMLQAYDSVMVEADVEFGGTDQRFNLLLGRELQTMMGQEPQQVFMTPILIGTDGVRKMSKSLGNYVGVTDPPEEMFGKAMSIPDNLILQYFELLSDVSNAQLEEYRREMAAGSLNPMDLKKALGRELVTQLHDAPAAAAAEAHFVSTVQNKELPDEIPEQTVTSDVAQDIVQVMSATGQAASLSVAKRLIDQGGVSIDGVKVNDRSAPVRTGNVLKVGKRSIVKIIVSDK